MSCANPQDNQDGPHPERTLMPRKRNVQLGTCVKCRVEKGRFRRLAVTYCKSCFFHQYHARVCKSLYPPLTPTTPHASTSQPTNLRPLPQDGDVVLAVSGGAGSMSLLDRFFVDSWVNVSGWDGVTSDGGREKEREKQGGPDKGSQRPAKLPLWRKGWVVHVDFANLLPLSPNQSRVIRKHLESSNNLNFDFHYVEFKIEDAFDDSLAERIEKAMQSIEASGDSTHELKIQQDPSQASSSLNKLRNLLASVPHTSHPHILHQLLSSLLLLISVSLRATHLVSGETSTRVAQRIIASTANGGGWGLPLEMAGSRALTTGRGGSVVRLKPLRDTMVREAAYYCWLKRIEMWNANGWDGFVEETGTGTGRRSIGDSRGKGGVNSLERLTEDFINGLMVTHPSTVSTITRTGSKLQFRGAKDALETVCPLCGLPSEPSSIAWKARTALTALPRLQAEAGLDRPRPPIKEDALTESLCYACLTALQPALEEGSASMTTLELPKWVHDRIHGRLDQVEDGREGHLVESHIAGEEMSRERMKEVVGDFLIGEDE